MRRESRLRLAPTVQSLVFPAVESGPQWAPVLPSCASAEMLSLYCVSKLARCAVLRFAAEAKIVTPDSLAADVIGGDNPDLCASVLDRSAWAWGATMIAGSFSGLVQADDAPPPVLRTPVEGVLRLYLGDVISKLQARTFLLRVVDPEETPEEKVLRIYRTLGACDPVALPSVEQLLGLGMGRGRKSFAAQVTVGSADSTLPALLLRILSDLLPVLPLRENAILGPVLKRMRRFATTADPPPARLRRRAMVGDELFTGEYVPPLALNERGPRGPTLRAGRRAGGRNPKQKRSSHYGARSSLLAALEPDQKEQHVAPKERQLASAPASLTPARDLFTSSSVRSIRTFESAGSSVRSSASPWAREIAALSWTVPERAVSPRPVAHNRRALESLETWYIGYQNSKKPSKRRTQNVHKHKPDAHRDAVSSREGMRQLLKHQFTDTSRQFLIASGIVDDDDSDM
jgi:hypothetical protein